jgi:hypothetical protein
VTLYNLGELDYKTQLIETDRIDPTTMLLVCSDYTNNVTRIARDVPRSSKRSRSMLLSFA